MNRSFFEPQLLRVLTLALRCGHLLPSLGSMFGRLSASSRRLLASLAYTGLAAIVALLAYLTFANLKQREVEPANDPLEQIQAIQLGSFATRVEKTAKSQRLVVTFKLRLTSSVSMDAFVYVAARNDHSEPGVWGVWPPQEPGGAFTKGGHFRSHDPTTGHAIRLMDSWHRVTAPIEQPARTAPFDTVIVYLVATDGQILLARPFAL
jgi:hypothetical protein